MVKSAVVMRIPCMQKDDVTTESMYNYVKKMLQQLLMNLDFDYFFLLWDHSLTLKY